MSTESSASVASREEGVVYQTDIASTEVIISQEAVVPFRFLDLPADIRYMIYKQYFLPHAATIDVRMSPRGDNRPNDQSGQIHLLRSLLLVSKQILGESEPVLLENKVFRFRSFDWWRYTIFTSSGWVFRSKTVSKNIKHVEIWGRGENMQKFRFSTPLERWANRAHFQPRSIHVVIVDCDPWMSYLERSGDYVRHCWRLMEEGGRPSNLTFNLTYRDLEISSKEWTVFIQISSEKKIAFKVKSQKRWWYQETSYDHTIDGFIALKLANWFGVDKENVTRDTDHYLTWEQKAF